MSAQPIHRFLTLLPSYHATFSATAIDTAVEGSDSPTMHVDQKKRRSSSTATSFSTASDKAAAPAGPIAAPKRASTFLSNSG